MSDYLPPPDSAVKVCDPWQSIGDAVSVVLLRLLTPEQRQALAAALERKEREE